MKLLSLVLVLSFLASCAQVKIAPTSKTHSTDALIHIRPSAESEEIKFNGERALLAANSIGVHRVIVVSNSYSKMAYRDYARTQNSYVAREAKKNPTKIAGACAVNPLMDWATEEMRRCKSEGLKILKLHTLASGMDLLNHGDLIELKKVLTHAIELKLTVIINGSFPRKNEAKQLFNTLGEYQKLRFIITQLKNRELELLKDFKHPKYLLVASVLPSEEKEMMVKHMKEIGFKKFIFGSDWPVYHPAEVLHALQEMPLSSSEVEDIVYHNADALDDLF